MPRTAILLLERLIKAAPVLTPRRPSQIDYARMLRSQRDRLHEIADELARGEITPRQWGERFQQILIDGHTESWTLGRQRAGDLSGPTIDDFLVGIARADGDAQYLLAFIDDIEGDRYRRDDGSLKVGAVKARANLYVGKMRGTAGEAFVETSEDEEEFNWVLSAVENHCSDCPELALLSPFTKDTAFAHPGDGSTPCLGNCLCHWVRASDGIEGFKPVEL